MTTTEAGAGEEGVRRRDWIHIAAISTAAVGAGGIVIPLVSQMGPSADVLAASTTRVDISSLEAGQTLKAVFRGQPLFVKRLTGEEIERANSVEMSELPDPQTLAERTNPADQSVLITLGVCTHLGCVPLGAAEGESKGDFGGYFCPCHGSHYDVAGRIRKGPAPKNLVVPEYEINGTVIQVG
ncbi:MAG: ubiquinol-cytochrome c reductase iron-sulfur subunit [Erythrobacter sp.]|jgi:ubiquinol-cytochrome c reductase iron-sulfur subunit|nr:ubiquinol-cytochrome c reductase iron-sulfur subunit [Erythrobacter sp.]